MKYKIGDILGNKIHEGHGELVCTNGNYIWIKLVQGSADTIWHTYEKTLTNIPKEFHCNIKRGYEYMAIGPENVVLHYRKIKDTKLARKMYTDIHKEEGGFIWVK